MNTMTKPDGSEHSKGWLHPAAWIFYLLVGWEILFMISPAAFYFYSLYGPALNGLARWAGTAWLTQFFLPHIATSHSFVLNALPSVGGAVALLGAAVFLAAAGQLYWSKLRRRGPVTTGLYAVSRHPQYVGLALLGLGALLLWPRFLVLIAYVAMLFMYRYLAAAEERRCAEVFGGPYRSYQAHTRAVLNLRPFRDGSGAAAEARGATSRSDSVRMLPRGVAGIGLAVLIAFGLREYALSAITAHYEARAAVLSPARLEEAELCAAYRTALGDPRVRDALATVDARPLVVHVIPKDWYLADLPLPLAAERRGHDTPANFDRHHYRVLFSRARSHAPEAVGKNIVRSAYGIEPLWLVEVDLQAGKVTGAETPPAHVRWGDIPSPLF